MQTQCGVLQSDPILETFLAYYSSSGIMELPPHEDPGVGNRPCGVLALATVAVRTPHPSDPVSSCYCELG